MNPPEAIWGGANKVYTFQRDAYNRLVDTKNPHKFSRLIDAFHSAAAVGIRLDGISNNNDGAHREELVNVYSIDPKGIFWTILSARFPELTGLDRFEKLQSYADYGILRLDEEISIFGNIQSALDAIFVNH